MKVFITGSSGYLGQHLLHYLAGKEGYDITAAYGSLSTFASDCASLRINDKSKLQLVDHDAFNLSSKESIRSFIMKNTFDVVIHLAALSALKKCEESPEEAMTVNCPTPLIEALVERNKSTAPNHSTKFIFLSTDQVYDGFTAPYSETDETKPINIYGKSKLAFEKKLLDCCGDQAPVISPVILRSSLILGGITPIGNCRKQSFIQFVYQCLMNKQENSYFNNEYRNVVFVGDICHIIDYFAKNDLGEDIRSDPVFNMGGAERVARDQIATAVCKASGLNPKYIKVAPRSPPAPLDAVPSAGEVIVRNPPDISMHMTKLEKVTGISMKGLDKMVGEIIDS